METLLPPGPTPDPKLMLGGIVMANVFLPHHRIGRFLLYPLSFLSTWAHEMGHVLATILAGGRVKKVKLYANLGGEVVSRRPDTYFGAFLSPMLGLLGPSITGGLIMYLGAKPAGLEWALEGLGAMIIGTALLWVRNLFGLVFCLGTGALLIYLSMIPDATIVFWSIQALAIRFAIESLSDLEYLFTKYVDGDQPSDTQLLSKYFFFPYWFWGVLIGGMSICILGAALLLTWGSVIIPPAMATAIEMDLPTGWLQTR